MSDRTSLCAESLPDMEKRCSLDQLRQPNRSSDPLLLPRHSLDLPLLPKSSISDRQSREWPVDPRAALMEPLWDSEGSEGKHALPSPVSIHHGLPHSHVIWYMGLPTLILRQPFQASARFSEPRRQLVFAGSKHHLQ